MSTFARKPAETKKWACAHWCVSPRAGNYTTVLNDEYTPFESKRQTAGGAPGGRKNTRTPGTGEALEGSREGLGPSRACGVSGLKTPAAEARKGPRIEQENLGVHGFRDRLEIYCGIGAPRDPTRPVRLSCTPSLNWLLPGCGSRSICSSRPCCRICW
jgi:hypothetical protein